LQKLGDEELSNRATTVLGKANAKASDLAALDVTQANIDELDQALQNFNGTKEKPRTVAAERAAQTTSLPTLIRDGSDLLRSQIDRLVNLFRRSNSQFVAGYRSARVIIDRPGTHSAPKKPTLAPQVAQPSPVGAAV
jgi:hypothetical protein